MNSILRQKLKSRAQALKPVVLIGANGLTDAVVCEADNALKTHELIKVKMHGMERDDRRICSASLCERLSAQLVQSIGNLAVVYRENPEK